MTKRTRQDVAPASRLGGRWVDVVLALLILTAGLYVRLVDLGTQSFDTDELFHFFAAESLVDAGNLELPGGLVYGRAAWFTEVVAESFRLRGPSEAAARLPAALFGAAVVPLVYWIGVTWFGRSAAIFAALAVALVPFNVVHSRRARMYAPLELLFTFGFFAFYQGLIARPRRAAAWLISSAAALAAAYNTHVLTGLFAPVAATYAAAATAVVGWTRGRAAALRSRYAAIAALLIVGGLVALVSNPWIPDAVASLRSAPVWGAPAVSGSRYLYLLRQPWMFPLFALLILGAAQTLIERNRAGIYTLFVAGAYLAFLSTAVVQQARYMVLVFPLIALISGIGFGWIVDRQAAEAVVSLSASPGGRERPLLPAWGRHIAATAVIGGLWLLPAVGWARQSLRAGTTTDLSVYGAPARPSWRAACEYVVAQGKDTVIVATDPLAVLKYCGRVEFGIDGDSWIGSQQYPLAEDRPAPVGERPLGPARVDPYSGATMILTLDDLLAVQEAHPQGWFLADRSRYVAPGFGGGRSVLPRHLRSVPPHVYDYVAQTFRRHDFGSDGSVLVFSWDEAGRRRIP